MNWIPIVKIEPDGEEECLCIAVSHPSRLYVTEGGIVTHNTTVDRSAASLQPPADDSPFRSLGQFRPVEDSTLSRRERDALDHIRRAEGDVTIRAVAPDDLGLREGAGSGGRFLKAFESLFGKRVLFVEQGQRGPLSFDGAATPAARNVIVLDAAGGQPLTWMAGHELIHALKAQRPDLWQEMRDALLGMAGDWSAYRRERSGSYTESEMEAEFIADFVGGQFRQPDFWRRASERNPSIFKNLAKAALEMLDALLRKVGLMPRDVQGYFAELNAARDVVLDALEKYAQGPMPERVLNDGDVADYSRKENAALGPMRLVSMRMSEASAVMREKIREHKATADERTIDGERIEEAGYLVRKDADMAALADLWLDGFIEQEGAAGRTAAESRETLRQAIMAGGRIGGEVLDVDTASVILGRLIEGRHFDIGLERSEIEAWAQKVFSQAGYALRQARNIWDPLTELQEKADAVTGAEMGAAFGVPVEKGEDGKPDAGAVSGKVYAELRQEVEKEMQAEMDATMKELRGELAEAQRLRKEAEAEAAKQRLQREAEARRLQNLLKLAEAKVAELEARPADSAEANERLAEELLKAREKAAELRGELAELEELLAEETARANQEREVGIAIGREEGRAEAEAEAAARQPEAQLERFELWLMGEKHAPGLKGLPTVEQVARKFIDAGRWDADRFRAFIGQLFPDLDPNILDDAVDRVAEMMHNRAEAARRRAVEKLIDRLRERGKNPRADSKFSKFFDYLDKAARLGVLDERVFVDAFAASWGLHGLTPAIIASLRQQWQTIQGSGLYGMKLETAERKFNETINRLAPAQSWLNFFFSNYQSRVLSSLSSMWNQFSALGRLISGMSAIQRAHQAGLVLRPGVVLSEWLADVGGLLQNMPLMLTALRGESLGHLPRELAHGRMPTEQRTALLTKGERLRVGRWKAGRGATFLARAVEFWTWRTIRAAEGLTGVTDAQGHFRLALTNHYRAQGMTPAQARQQALRDISADDVTRQAAEAQARQEQAAGDIGRGEWIIRRRVEEIIQAGIDARQQGKAYERQQQLTAHAQFKTMPLGLAGFAVSKFMSKIAPGNRGVLRFWLLFGRFLGHTVDVSLGYMPVAHFLNKKVSRNWMPEQRKAILEVFGSEEAYQRMVDARAISAGAFALGTGAVVAAALAARDNEEDEPFFCVTGSAPGNDRDVKDALAATGKWGEQQIRIGGVPVLNYGLIPELAPVLGVLGNISDAIRFNKVLHQRGAEDREKPGKRRTEAGTIGLAIAQDYAMTPIKRSTYRQWFELLSGSMTSTSTGQTESWAQRLGSVLTKPVEGMTRFPVVVDVDKVLKKAEGGMKPDGFVEGVLRRLPFAESVFGVGTETFNAYGERTPAWDVISAFPTAPDFSPQAEAAARLNVETGTRRGLPDEPSLKWADDTVREATPEEMSRYYETSGRLFTESLLRNEADIRRAFAQGGQGAAQKVVGNISRKANETAREEVWK